MADSVLLIKWQELLKEKLTQVIADASASNQLEDFNIAYLNFLAQQKELPSNSLFKPIKVRQGDWAVAQPHSWNLRNSHDALRLIYVWLKSIGDSELDLHNYLLSQYLGLKTQIQRIAGTVADLELFQNDTAGGVYLFGDNFNTADKIDATSDRDTPNAYLDRNLHGVTLAPSGDMNTPKPVSVNLNPLSNGVSGNNQQIDALGNYNDINAIIDNSLGSWYEYESVDSIISSVPLYLDFTINYNAETLINCISIYLNNLGSTLWPTIQDIQVSLDGKNFTSLKDEIESLSPEVDPFQISPQATDNGGRLVFYCRPRLVRHLRLIIQQSGYYLINTDIGTKFRYAIGIREVLSFGINYQDSGELISKPFNFSLPVYKAMLDTQWSSLDIGSLCSLDHYISSDNGLTWIQIQELNGEDGTIPKVITFDKQTIKSLTYRAIFKRQQDANAVQSLTQSVVDAIEYLPFPSAPPYSLSLSNNPQVDSISVCMPFSGSAGRDAKLTLGISDGAANLFFVSPYPLTGDEQVWVNKQLWSRVDNLKDAAAGDRVYSVNCATATINFGDGVYGMIPPAGFTIYLWMSPERLLFSSGEAISTTLQHPFIQNQDSVSIYMVSPALIANREVLARGATILHLAHAHLDDGFLITFSGNNTVAFTLHKEYIDGSTELTDPGDYSIDYLRGIIYTFTQTPVDNNTFITYQYTPRTLLSNDQWVFAGGQEINLVPSAFKTQEVIGEDLSNQAGNYLIYLANKSLVKGFLTFSGNPIPTQELDFIDGLMEFTGIILQKDESVPAGEQVFSLAHVPRQDYQVLFSDVVVFAREVTSVSAVKIPGDYNVNYDTGEVHAYSSTTGGRVDYYYHHELSTLAGSYSVDYANGIIHLYEALAGSASVSYQFCHYEAEYYITTNIPQSTYKVDPINKQIVFTNIAFLNSLSAYASDNAVAVSYKYLAQNATNAGILTMLTAILQSYTLRLLFKEAS